MLPTTVEETEVIHLRLKASFAHALTNCQHVTRPWIWGCGDNPRASSSSPSVLEGAHECITIEQRLELLRTHGKEWADDEIRYHIHNMLKHRAEKDDHWKFDIPGFCMIDPLALLEWEAGGKEKCSEWCRRHPEVVHASHHIVTALLVHDHWVPMWIEPCSNYMLVHLQHDGITKLDSIPPFLDHLGNLFGKSEHVIHWTPQHVPSHDLCGAAAICFLGHVIVDAHLPQDCTELNYAHSNMKASFVQAVFESQCCRCPSHWGRGPVVDSFHGMPNDFDRPCWMPEPPVALNGGQGLGDQVEIIPFPEGLDFKRTNSAAFAQCHGYASSQESFWLDGDTRQCLLDCQSGLWANDEVLFQLRQLKEKVGMMSCTLQSSDGFNIIDPVLFTKCVQGELGISTVQDFLHEENFCMITVYNLDQHWIPVLLFREPGIFRIETWNHSFADHTQVHQLCAQIAQNLGNLQFVFEQYDRDFQVEDKRGALAIAYLSHCLLNTGLPRTHGELEVMHNLMRDLFRSALVGADKFACPVLWGNGDANATAGISSVGSNQCGHSEHQQFHSCIPTETRMEMLRTHGKRWGDDEIRFHICNLIERFDKGHCTPCSIPGFLMLEPLLFSTWDTVGKLICESWCRAHSQVKERGVHIVTAQFVDDHWVPIWIVPSTSHLTFHFMHDGVTPFERILPMVEVLCTQLGFSDHVVHWFPQRLPTHDYCGSAAVAFLGQVIVGAGLPNDLSALQNMHSNMKASFVQAVLTNQCCRCPVAWGSGPSASLVKSLTDVLAKHGVPEQMLEQRALQAIRAIGSDTIQNALKAKNVWRSLKAVGSNAKFQFILPAELETLIDANKGSMVGMKIKPSKINAKAPVPNVIDPTKLTLLEGAFRYGGQPLPQISAQQIGPVANGIAVLSLKDASPYLKAGQAVSSGPLAMIVLDDPTNHVQTALPHVKMMVPCICSLNQEPLLVEATLVQLGQGHVEKHVAESAIALDPLDVVSVKIMTYRDECPVPWDEFVAAPIKQIVQMFPLLRRCHESNCNCECWHNPDALQIRDPIMDEWRRQFLSASFRPVQAGKSDIFSVCVRVPATILPSLLASSGQSGSYLEPRTPDGKQVMEEYVVIWAPKLNASELAHLKQTNPGIIGIARLGERRGVRVKQAQAQTIHAIVRPEATFLPNGPKVQYCAGPFPWGTDRAAIMKAMKQVGWHVQALQPMQPVPNKGSMWLLQSVDPPPESILCTSHGDVVITKHRPASQQPRRTGSFTVGSVSTLTLCSPEASKTVSEQDPWLQADPWGPYKARTPAQATVAADGIQQLEERIQTAVLSKIPVNMEQDDTTERISSLEEKVHLLMGKNQNLEAQFNDFSAHSTQQFAVVQSQIQQQSSQFHGQLESQSQSIQAMFEQQVTQIRGLLSKRPRDDTME